MDPILTMKFYTALFRNDVSQKELLLQTNALCNRAYSPAGKASHEWEQMANMEHANKRIGFSSTSSTSSTDNMTCMPVESENQIMSMKLKKFFLNHCGSLGSSLLHYAMRYYHKHLTLAVNLLGVEDPQLGDKEVAACKEEGTDFSAKHLKLSDLLKQSMFKATR